MPMQSDLSEFNAFQSRTISDQSEPIIEGHWPMRAEYWGTLTNKKTVLRDIDQWEDGIPAQSVTMQF